MILEINNPEKIRKKLIVEKNSLIFKDKLVSFVFINRDLDIFSS